MFSNELACFDHVKLEFSLAMVLSFKLIDECFNFYLMSIEGTGKRLYVPFDTIKGEKEVEGYSFLRSITTMPAQPTLFPQPQQRHWNKVTEKFMKKCYLLYVEIKVKK